MYQRDFGKAFSNIEIIEHYLNIKSEVFSKLGNEIGYYDFFKFRLSYIANEKSNLFIFFVSDLTDDFFSIIKQELYNLREGIKDINKFISNDLELDISKIENINSKLDNMNRSIKPKIAIVGFSGVGKTTIKNLIMFDKIPLEHIPTITGDIATIKIGKLYFFLWDFAGQKEYAFLWKKFIQGSNAVLIITDSTQFNVETSNYFIDLIKKEVPHAHCAIIGNKQDLPNALKAEEIEMVLGVKAYPMIANRSENRSKMIQIVADILEINIETSVLLEPIVEKEKLIKEAQITLKNCLYEKTVQLYDRIVEICLNDLADESLGKEYSLKSEKLKNYLKGLKALQGDNICE